MQDLYHQQYYATSTFKPLISPLKLLSLREELAVRIGFWVRLS